MCIETPLTHEFLAFMLVVRRATVNLAVTALRRADLIRYHRGHVTILDGKRLEAAACACYRTITDTVHRLVGRAWPASSRADTAASPSGGDLMS